MAKQKKQPRPKAAAPKGFRDYFGAEVTRRQSMLAEIARIYHLYGFDALETSAVETVEALGKFLPDVDRPNEGVFAWEEDNDWLALRYDMTAPLARVAAQYRNDLPSPYRRYTMGPVWRNEKPGPGRFRQFYQCDADTVGSASMAADAEICAMLADVLEAVGIARGDYVVRVNNRKVLDGLLDVVMQQEGSPAVDTISDLITSGDLASASRKEQELRSNVLRTLDKYDKVGSEGVMELLTSGRKDSSGAFIDGVGLNQIEASRFVDFLQARRSDNSETIERLSAILGNDPAGSQGISELKIVADLLEAQGYGPDRIVIDPSVVRGLGYYTGPVYEAELIGDLARFGSVAGGGRYDDLVKRFTGQEVPATGVSIGVDRLLAALSGQERDGRHDDGPVIVTIMDRSRTGDYLTMVRRLRDAGIRAELYLGNPKNFGNQLKYADRRGAPIAVIQGEDEAARGVVQIKDLKLGAELAASLSHEEWRDQPAQVECAVGDMVDEIRKRLS